MGADFGQWFSEITAQEYWEKMKVQSEAAVQYLKEQGCTQLGVLGFCWGCMAAERLASTGHFESAASCYGIHNNTDGYKAAIQAGCDKLLYVSAAGDEFFSDVTVEALKQDGATVEVKEGVYHGYVLRGDFDNNLEIKKAADDTMGLISSHFIGVSA